LRPVVLDRHHVVFQRVVRIIAALYHFGILLGDGGSYVGGYC
jgi:hypothetical protein